MPPHVPVHADDLDAVQAGRISDEQPLPLGQDRVVGRVPRHAQTLGDPGHRQVLDHGPHQPPPQPGTGDLGPRLRRGRGVLAPHVAALDAPVAMDGEQQGRGSPERLVRQLPGPGVPRPAMAPAPAAPVLQTDDPAGKDRPVGFEQLPGDLQADVAQTGEGGQVRRMKVASGPSRSFGWLA